MTHFQIPVFTLAELIASSVCIEKPAERLHSNEIIFLTDDQEWVEHFGENQH